MIKRLIFALIFGFGVILSIISFVGIKDVLVDLFKVNIMFLFHLILASFMVIFIDSLRTKFLLKEISFSDSVKNSILGFFVGALTPFSAGGQPFQIYHLTTKKIPFERSSSVVAIKFITSFTITIFGGLIFLSFYFKDILTLVKAGWILLLGVTVSFSMYLFFFFLILSKRFQKIFFTSKIFIFIFGRLFSLEDVKEEVLKRIEAYSKAIKVIMKEDKKLFFVNVILTLLMIFFNLITPFFAMKAVNPHKDLDMIKVMGFQLVANLIVYFLPTPGASGGVEGMFYWIFSSFLDPKEISIALILWRFFTYHLALILGSIVSFIEGTSFSNTKVGKDGIE